MQIAISHHTHDPMPAMAAQIASGDEFAWLTLDIGDTQIRIFAHDREGARAALRALRSAIDAAGREDVFGDVETRLNEPHAETDADPAGADFTERRLGAVLGGAA